MATSITDNTVNPLLVAAGQTLTPFSAVQVSDTVGTTETVTISLGYNYFSYYSPTADFGSISDPSLLLSGSLYDPTTHMFTETGLVAGDPASATGLVIGPPSATQLLKRLIYTPPALQNGQSATVTATVTVASGGDVPRTDPKSIIIDAVSPPLISGTVANAPVAGVAGATIRPFATTNVIDTNFAYSAKDIATIKITDGGVLTDADGLLTGLGLSKTPDTAGTYTLSNADYAYSISNELRNLEFTLSNAQSRTIAFELDVADPKANLGTADTQTSLFVIGPTPTPVIAGTLAGQTVTAGNVIKPFASVTISDNNLAPKDSVTISLLNGSGIASDANGTLSGPGLTETAAGSGVYTLATADPATITKNLDALTFTPAPLPVGQTSVTTKFKLDVTDAGQTATDSTTAVATNPFPPQQPPGNFLVVDQTTGQGPSPLGGAPYSGPVLGLTQELILANLDNINVVSKIPNVFIHTSSGNDSIDVSVANGNNVLDGGTGSNFLTGGTGNDNFYLDNRNPSAPIFSTIVNFHRGDNATVFGVNATDFSVLKLDNQGAPGYTGLDIIFSAAGRPATSFVLAGYTTADLSNGRLSMSYGKTADLPNIPGSEYLTVHAV